MSRTPYRTVIDAPERAEIRETIAGLRREVRRLRKLARDLYFGGDFYGSHEPGCDCRHCTACEGMKQRRGRP